MASKLPGEVPARRGFLLREAIDPFEEIQYSVVECVLLLDVGEMRGRLENDEFRAFDLFVNSLGSAHRGAGIILAHDDQRGQCNRAQALREIQPHNGP